MPAVYYLFYRVCFFVYPGTCETNLQYFRVFQHPSSTVDVGSHLFPPHVPVVRTSRLISVPCETGSFWTFLVKTALQSVLASHQLQLFNLRLIFAVSCGSYQGFAPFHRQIIFTIAFSYVFIPLSG